MGKQVSTCHSQRTRSAILSSSPQNRGSGI